MQTVFERGPRCRRGLCGLCVVSERPDAVAVHQARVRLAQTLDACPPRYAALTRGSFAMLAASPSSTMRPLSIT